MSIDKLTPNNLYQKLLDNKEKINYNVGFTIPFIIGAYHRRGFISDDELQNSECISKVLDIILKMEKDGLGIALLDCTDCDNHLILQYKSQMAMESLREYPNIDDTIFLNHYLSELATKANLINSLWSSCGQIISEKKFSFEQKQWREFNEKEITFIDELN